MHFLLVTSFASYLVLVSITWRICFPGAGPVQFSLVNGSPSRQMAVCKLLNGLGTKQPFGQNNEALWLSNSLLSGHEIACLQTFGSVPVFLFLASSDWLLCCSNHFTVPLSGTVGTQGQKNHTWEVRSSREKQQCGKAQCAVEISKRYCSPVEKLKAQQAVWGKFDWEATVCLGMPRNS